MKATHTYVAHIVILSTYVVTNDNVTSVCIYYAMFLIIILEYAFLYKKKSWL